MQLTLAPNTAAYLAGIVDGEGYITLAKVHATNSYSQLLGIDNTSEALIIWLRDNIPGGSARLSREAEGRRETQYRWTLQSREELMGVLRCIIPFLIIKKLHAQLLLKCLVEVKTKRRGEDYTADDKESLEAYYSILRSLNARGPGSNEAKAKVVKLFAENQLDVEEGVG